MHPLIKLAISAAVITASSWLAGKNPRLAGWIIAMPLSSMLALIFAHAEHQDPVKSVAFAKGILQGVPMSLTFFVPFLFAEKLGWSFPALYAAGLGLLTTVFILTGAKF